MSRLTRHWPIVSALVVAVTLAACGGDGEEAAEEQSATTAPEEREATAEERAAAEGVLLTLDDFPTGWVQRPPDQADDLQLDLPEECAIFEEEAQEPGALVDLESDDFISPDEREISSGATVYVDENAAGEAYATGRQAIEQCRDPLREAFSAAIEEDLTTDPDSQVADAVVTDFNFDDLSFADLGDETIAYRMSFSIEADYVSGESLGFDFFFDIIGIRIGRVAGGLTYFSINDTPDTAAESQLMGFIEERMRAAEGQLD